MSTVLNKPIVLELNANWQRIGWKTVKEAFTAMCGGIDGGSPPALAMDISSDNLGNLSIIPTKWEDWKKLPVRESDIAVNVKDGAIRCPTVIIAPTYSKMPMIKPALTNEAIFERDGYVDQYTGEKLARSEVSVDHVVPKDRGGKAKCWKNMVTCRADRNHKKGNKLNEEIGYSLIRKPFEPKPVPKSVTIKEVRRPEHAHFMQ